MSEADEVMGVVDIHCCAAENSLVVAPGQQPQRAVHSKTVLLANISGDCFVDNRGPAVDRDPG